MKSFQKALSLFCALGLLASLSVPAFAADVPTELEYAYMDTEHASPQLREKILDARLKLVYGDQAWSADGSGFILNADGTVTKLPLFSDLFPDWDLAELSVIQAEPFYGGVTRGATPHFLGTITIKTAPWPNASTPFYQFNANGDIVYAGAVSLPSGCKHFHVGLTNMDTGNDVNWYGNLTLGQAGGWNTEEGVRYGVRMSAGESNISGFATACVSTNKDDFNGDFVGP